MIKNILFDFDGVILDSMPIRDYGFKEIFKDFDDDLVNKLLEYHNQNGGLSRYVKIKYFYNKLLKQEISEEKITNYADNFSKIMKIELVDKRYLIADTLEFIKESYKKYNLHIVSGSDEKELQYLCKELRIDSFFQSVNGSPTHKNILVKNVLSVNRYIDSETILIGDSVNDYDAAIENNLDFYGFNNTNLIDISKAYISDYANFLFFDYGVGEISHSKENKTFFNIKNIKEIDYLIFLDSRGLSINKDSFDDTFLNKLMKSMEANHKTYVAVSRPKNLVVFASLLNFLNNNSNVTFKNLITNLGFVDFTPKKEDNLKDIKNQIKFLYDYDINTEKLSSYKLSTGKDESLFSLLYEHTYTDFIISVFMKYNFRKIYFINTPLIDKKIKVSRRRPLEFFDKIKTTNNKINKINKISNSEVVDIKNLFEMQNQERYVDDAVHFTVDGHRMIHESILSRLLF